MKENIERLFGAATKHAGPCTSSRGFDRLYEALTERLFRPRSLTKPNALAS